MSIILFKIFQIFECLQLFDRSCIYKSTILLKILISVPGVTLQKKWKNIRDAYNKEFKKDKSIPSGSGACKGSKYMYFDRLSFLQKTVENKETTSNIHEAKN